MMSLPTAILLAGSVVGLGLAIGLTGFAYFLYQLLLSISIFRVANSVREAQQLHREFMERAPEPEAVMPETPDIDPASFSDRPDVMKRLIAKQTASVPERY